MDFQTLLVDVQDRVATITLNRPQALNALSMVLLEELEHLFDEMAQNRDIWGVVITGAGRAFCAGADLGGKDRDNVSPNAEEKYLDRILWVNGIFSTIENFARPVVAAVNGFALGGGCELAMACDFRIAGDAAVFGMPEVGLGVMASYGGTQRLPRLVGEGIAKEMLFTARKIDAAEAAKIGLVNRVVPADTLMQEAADVMQTICRQAPISVKYTKMAVNKGLELPLDYALQLEAQLLPAALANEDSKEGRKAFAEKRKPTFNNH